MTQASRRCSWQDAVALLDPQITADALHHWPFDRTFPVDVCFCSLPGAERPIRMNRHDYFELNYVCEGEMAWRVQERSFSASAGDLVIVGGSQYHTAFAAPSEGGSAISTRFAALYFMPDLIRARDARGEDLEYLSPFLLQGASGGQVVRAKTDVPARVFELMRLIAAELPARASVERLSVKTHLKLMLLHLVKHYAGVRGSPDVLHRRQEALGRLRPLFDHIDRHSSEPLSLAQAAKLVGTSRPRFTRSFREVTGLSFNAYLTDYRIARAEDLLRRTDKSICEVGHEVGYGSQSHFGVVFRRMRGMAPLVYRATIRRRQESSQSR